MRLHSQTANYHGCSVLPVCTLGQYGAGCSKECRCGPSQPCDHVSGRCVCPPGREGQQCHQCESPNHASFIIMTCLAYIVIHDPLTRPSAYKQPDSSTDCAEGLWGEGCRQKCRCAGSSLCDPVTGECFCPAGLRGRKCRRGCPRGRYGVDCKQVSFTRLAVCSPSHDYHPLSIRQKLLTLICSLSSESEMPV